MSTTAKKATVVAPVKKTVAKKTVAKKAPVKAPVKKVVADTVVKPKRVLYRWECVLDGCERHGRWVRSEDGGQSYGLNHIKIRERRGQVGHDVRIVDDTSVRG